MRSVPSIAPRRCTDMSERAPKNPNGMNNTTFWTRSVTDGGRPRCGSHSGIQETLASEGACEKSQGIVVA